MKRFITSALIASFAIVQPINAAELLPSMEQTNNPAQFLESILCPSGAFDVDEARRFLFQLKREVKEKYGYELDFQIVIEEALRTMAGTGKFSETEISTAREFYSQLIESKTRICNDWHFGKKKDKHKHRKKKSPELMLPDGMALGYMCIFGGALLCVLPFGFTQALGTSFIVGGVMAVATSAGVQGEKPYYVDSETGQRITDKQSTGPSVGVGTSF